MTILSAVEQVAQHLRSELLRGSLTEVIPGVHPLAEALEVNHKTVRAALKQLEDEGLLLDQGQGLQRRIVLPKNHTPPPMRVALLVFESANEAFITELQYLLESAGHSPFIPNKSLLDLDMNVRRVARFVKKTEADAWVIFAGSREILEWFLKQETPAFALAGRRRELPIASVGPDKAPAMAEATRRLIALGHRRISMLCRHQVRLPHPAKSAEAFLNELRSAGIATGEFNLPNWGENKTGFKTSLDSLFERTPPTALILDEPYLFYAAYLYLAERGLRIPQDVSLICTDGDPGFIWCQPSVAYISWDHRPLINRVVRWTGNVARGKKDRRQSFTNAEFVEGGTIGPVSTGR